MEVKNKLEIRMPSCEKCALICDPDCSLGQLYDYACALHSFLRLKMKEAEFPSKEESQPSGV